MAADFGGQNGQINVDQGTDGEATFNVSLPNGLALGNQKSATQMLQDQSKYSRSIRAIDTQH
jgi:hypothetical protein